MVELVLWIRFVVCEHPDPFPKTTYGRFKAKINQLPERWAMSASSAERST